MIGEHALVGEFQRLQRLAIAGGDRRLDLGRRDAEARARQVDAIEAQRIVDQRRVAARPHVGDDRR